MSRKDERPTRLYEVLVSVGSKKVVLYKHYLHNGVDYRKGPNWESFRVDGKNVISNGRRVGKMNCVVKGPATLEWQATYFTFAESQAEQMFLAMKISFSAGAEFAQGMAPKEVKRELREAFHKD